MKISVLRTLCGLCCGCAGNNDDGIKAPEGKHNRHNAKAAAKKNVAVITSMSSSYSDTDMRLRVTACHSTSGSMHSPHNYIPMAQ